MFYYRTVETHYDDMEDKKMHSVSQRIQQIKQPWGGYLNPKQFTITSFDDYIELNAQENIFSGLAGLAVDYMTRYSMGTPAKKAFRVSLSGAKIIREEHYAKALLRKIAGLSDQSITYACKLVGYDVCFRAGIRGYRPVQEIEPDLMTISNLRNMINRSIGFLKQYGPVIKDGLTFEGGYTELIQSGDCDFITGDTLWDFKVSKKAPTSVQTLQLLVYYLMGAHSIHREFENIKYLGIFNPRLNKAYLLEIDSIAPSIIAEVSVNVIGLS